MFTTQKVGRKKETHIHFMLGFYVTYQPFYCSLALVMTFFYDHNILIQRVKEVIKAKFPLLKNFSKTHLTWWDLCYKFFLNQKVKKVLCFQSCFVISFVAFYAIWGNPVFRLGKAHGGHRCLLYSQSFTKTMLMLCCLRDPLTVFRAYL